ncbi:MAG TPA: hypothetical protein VGX49_09495 [Jatrophihabitans sp.]|jgi:hypothetical protein|nr:hypothetical protein [Jatrophihabitans sp.]
MTDTDTGTGHGAERPAGTDLADRHDVPIAGDSDNPWYGIPHELLAAGRSYDLDSAGGCG